MFVCVLILKVHVNFTTLPVTPASPRPALFQLLALIHIQTHTAGRAMIGSGCVAVSPGVLTLSVPCCHHCLEADNRMDRGGEDGTREINKADNL